MYLRIDLLKDMTEQMKLDIRKAEISALNQVVREAKKVAADELNAVYNIQKRDINRAIKVETAKAGNLRANLSVTGKKLPLIDFSARKNKQGVSIEIKRGGRKVLTHAFMPTMPTGHKGVFLRKGKTRLPIQEKFTQSIPQFFGSGNILNRIDEFVRRRLPELFNQERNKL